MASDVAAGGDREKAARLGRRIAEAASEIYGESDGATLVALGVAGLKAYAADVAEKLDERERDIIGRMVGSAQGRADGLRLLAAATAGSAAGSDGDRRGSSLSGLGSVHSIYESNRRDSLDPSLDGSEAGAPRRPSDRASPGSPRYIAVRGGAIAEDSKAEEASTRRPSIGRNVLTGRGSNVALTDEDRELLSLFDRLCESDERFAVEALLDQRSGSSLDPQLSIERRIKIAERALATGKPEGEETAAERGKRFSLGFSAVVRDQRALETIPRLDPKQSMRKATVHLDDLGGTSWSDRAHEFFRSLTFIIAHDSKYLHAWEAFIMILVLYVVFMVPIMIGFKWEPPGSDALLFWLGMGIDVLFMADILVNFNTSYVNETTKEIVEGSNSSFRTVASAPPAPSISVYDIVEADLVDVESGFAQKRAENIKKEEGGDSPQKRGSVDAGGKAPPGQARRSMARKQSNQSGPPGRGRLIRQASKQFNHLGLGPGGRQKRSSANAPSPR